MEKVNDILNEIKNRLSNPFLFSFIIAWLVTNWKITVGLFVDIEVLQKDGYTSYIDLIEKNKSCASFFWYPLMYAFIYIIIMPAVKMGISILNTYFEKWTGDKNLKILAGSKVPFDKYINLVNQYKDKQQKIEQLINEENEIKVKNQILNDEKQRLEIQLNDLSKKYRTEIDAIQNSEVINGDWNFYRSQENKHYIIKIKDNVAQILNIKNDEIMPATELNEEFSITNFYYNKSNGSLIFCLISKTNFDHNILHSLKFNGGENGFLEGVENFNQRIKYIRIEE